MLSHCVTLSNIEALSNLMEARHCFFLWKRKLYKSVHYVNEQCVIRTGVCRLTTWASPAMWYRSRLTSSAGYNKSVQLNLNIDEDNGLEHFQIKIKKSLTLNSLTMILFFTLCGRLFTAPWYFALNSCIEKTQINFSFGVFVIRVEQSSKQHSCTRYV